MPVDRLFTRLRAWHLEQAIDSSLCIRCTAPHTTTGHNTLCNVCKSTLASPVYADEAWLLKKALDIYRGYLELRRLMMGDTFTAGVDGQGTYIEHRLGAPFGTARMPNLDTLTVPGEEGKHNVQALDAPTRKLLEEAMLTSMQCGALMILLHSTMLALADDPYNPLTRVEEICFAPEHSDVTNHWVYRVTLRDGQRYAVAFADRQLGWREIVRDWDDYVLERFADTNDQAVRFVREREGCEGVEAWGLGCIWSADVEHFTQMGTQWVRLGEDEVGPYWVYSEGGAAMERFCALDYEDKKALAFEVNVAVTLGRGWDMAVVIAGLSRMADKEGWEF